MPDGGDAPIAFGQRMLALLETGSFTASYKYAVLLALIDAVLEGVDEHGDPPEVVGVRDIGRRVLAMYWPQSRPFTAAGPLRQSTQTGNIVAKIADFRQAHGLDDRVTLEQARAVLPTQLAAVEHDVIATVIRYPIPLLQKVGSGGRAVEQRFIYEHGWSDGVTAAAVRRPSFDDRMGLVDGAGGHLVALAGLLRPVIQREWLSFVARRNDAEVEELRLQRGNCCYCGKAARGGWEIDHFLPWSRWPDNTLDNLVVAHLRCNNDKRAALAGLDHVARWWERFEPGPLSADLNSIAVETNRARRPHATQGAARALYLRQPAGTMLWVARPGHIEVLDRRRLHAVMLADRLGLAADEAGTFTT